MRAMDFAKYIITVACRKGHDITNLQLQKILYDIQSEYMSFYDSPAFDDEFTAWEYSPVVLNVYDQFCGYGGMPIRLAFDVDIPDDDKAIINPIIERDWDLAPWDIPHAYGSWQVYRMIYDNGNGRGLPIPQDLIRNFRNCYYTTQAVD